MDSCKDVPTLTIIANATPSLLDPNVQCPRFSGECRETSRAGLQSTLVEAQR